MDTCTPWPGSCRWHGACKLTGMHRLATIVPLLLALSCPTTALANEPAAPLSELAEHPPPAEVTLGPAPGEERPATSARDESRYAEREAASPESKEYRGGDTVVIGATTATIVLAIVLLVVLL